MKDDPYTSIQNSVDRLFREWQKHPRLIVAVDFDDTVFDFRGHNVTFPRMAKLLQDCKEHNFYIVIYTASSNERWDFIKKHMVDIYGITPDSINTNPLPLPYGNWGKIYYNILLDDRAGLGDAINTLEALFSKIRQFKRTPKATVIHAPNSYDCSRSSLLDPFSPKLFLGGTIEMGNSEDWQSRVIHEMQGYDITILNPRRPDWDSSWTQEKSNVHFREQVEWELQALRDADMRVFYFAADSKSPITMLELGLHLTRRPVVFCPPGFYRKGNIDVSCEFYKVPVYETWEDFITAIKEDYEISIF